MKVPNMKCGKCGVKRELTGAEEAEFFKWGTRFIKCLACGNVGSNSVETAGSRELGKMLGAVFSRR